MDVDAYLARIAYTGPRDPSAETLAALHRAHMLSVPFENLDLHIGRSNVIAAGRNYRKIVRERRGGWCFELNGTFARLLERLGFTVTRYSAAVVLSEPGTPDFAHLTLRVDLDRPWLADVGFGDSFTAPLLLDETGPQVRERGRVYRLEPVEGSRVLLTQDGRPQYRFERAARAMTQFEGMCRVLQTPPGHFTDAPICSMATADGRISLAGMRLITTSGDDRHERDLADDGERREVLRDLFGVDLGKARFTDTGSRAGASAGSTCP
ncbi:MAG TPA: arylamine N-acetyltransferase [Gaiellales bacterium]